MTCNAKLEARRKHNVSCSSNSSVYLIPYWMSLLYTMWNSCFFSVDYIFRQQGWIVGSAPGFFRSASSRVMVVIFSCQQATIYTSESNRVATFSTFKSGTPLPFPPPSSFSSPPLNFPSIPSLLSLPLKVGPLNPARGLGEHCKLPQRGLGGAPAEIEFGAF